MMNLRNTDLFQLDDDYDSWSIDFNGMWKRIGLFYAERLTNHFHIYICVCSFLFFLFAHAPVEWKNYK